MEDGPHLETRGVAGNQERGYSALARLIRASGDEEVLALVHEADERLLAVDDPLVAVAHRRGLDAGGIRPSDGLGEGETCRVRHEAVQILILLLLRGHADDERGDDAVRADQSHRHIVLGDLLLDRNVGNHALAKPAVFLGKRHRRQAKLFHSIEQVVRKHIVLKVRKDARIELVYAKLLDGIEHEFLVFIQISHFSRSSDVSGSHQSLMRIGPR